MSIVNYKDEQYAQRISFDAQELSFTTVYSNMRFYIINWDPSQTHGVTVDIFKHDPYAGLLGLSTSLIKSALLASAVLYSGFV